jgi:tetratricopeptide (TPR) repeat protein
MGEGFELEAVQIALQLEGNNVEQARLTLLQQQSIQAKNDIPSRFSSDEEDSLSRPPVPSRRTNTNSRTMPNANMPFLKNINQEQIVQQANEFGTNVFNKASSFFNKSKQRIKETWDDIQSSDFSSAGSTPPEFRDRNERRKKFGNYEVDRYGNNSSDDDFPNSHERYKDDSDDEDNNVGYQKFTSNVEDFDSSPRQRNNLNASPVTSSRKSPAAAKQQDPEFDLLGMSNTSSFSQSRQQASPSPQFVSKPRPPVPTRSSKPLSTSTPPPTDKASTDAQTLSRSDQLRQKGNEFFKLGQYDQAQSYYTQAIDILPATHPNLIPLLNNRTASLLKSGDFNKVVEDCNQIILLIGPHKNYTPQNTNSTSLMAQMNLKEHYGKSVIKLGTALEGLEKFNDAMSKYQDLVQLGSSQFLPQANQGIQRCQKALKPKPKPAYKPPAKPVARADVNRSDAVQKLRQQQAAQDREDDQKLRITDQVEARVNAWKQGKEANIRALLSSLHTLLWSELNWKTIGLGDVLTEKQVKICYMRAIGKLHPDKLSQTTTVDQKLMANLVFATLNRSWDEFQNNGN